MDEEGAAGGVPVHSDGWKYSRVGMERTASPLAPPVGDK